MSLRIIARRTSQVAAAVNEDTFIFGASFPSETMIHDIRAKLQIITSGDEIAKSNAIAVATESWLLPVLDPDAAESLQVIMGKLVPKDIDTITLDLDTATEDTTVSWEPGEHNWAAIFNVGLQPEMLFHRHHFLSMSSPGSWVGRDTETPFSVEWLPLLREQMHVARRLAISQPTVLVFELITPGLDDTTATVEVALAENEWARYKYLEMVLEQALIDVLNLVEAGAQTPWEDAGILLAKILEPDVFEETAGFFQTHAFNVVGELTVDHSVVGQMKLGTLSSGRG